MKPINFREANKKLLKPDDMTDEECGSLPVFNNSEVCISKWKMNWKERFQCLLKGELWLHVHSGQTQPPVAIDVKYPFVRKSQNDRY